MPQQHITLSRLTDEICGVMAGAFQGRLYWVTAEVSNLSFYKAKGTWYFDLCEKDKIASRVIALLKCVAYGDSALEIIKFESETAQKFSNGLQVLVQVEVTFHEVYGMQLKLRMIDSYYTLGNLERQRQLTLERLLRENPEHLTLENGLYTSRNKLTGLPRVFARLAIISSANSAGLQDFIHTLENNEFGYRFTSTLFLTEVQGPENAFKMVAHLVDIFHSGVKYDAVAIVRGGGAQSDFLLFDTYEIARAVARFPIPIITGIGHQKNETLVDLMACCYTKTPTQAAELIISVNRKFEDALLSLRRGMLIRVQQKLSVVKESLSHISKILTRDSVHVIEKHEQQLSKIKGTISLSASGRIQKNSIGLHNAGQSLVRAVPAYFKTQGRIITEFQTLLNVCAGRFLLGKHAHLDHYLSLFEILDIKKTLNRGFAVVRRGSTIISEARELQTGEHVQVQLHDGSFSAQVEEME